MQPYTLTEVERETYKRYSELALPRHTSYPIAPTWTNEYGPNEFRDDLRSSVTQHRPYSLYIHIPFCESLCYYCACNKEIVPPAKRKQDDPTEAFLKAIEKEFEYAGEIVGGEQVDHIHLGGGSPTFLAPDDLLRLWSSIRSCFSISETAEIAVEVDPRITSFDHLQVLRTLGCNRISLGIQDFSLPTQQAVNRIQPFELVQDFVGWCRSLSFRSLNFDLIYGLPHQTIETMTDTLQKTLDLGPDRVAFYRLAVIPEIFRWQNVFQRTDLPAGELTLDLNLLAINTFLAAGYEFIGLDHFAKPDDALAEAYADESLHRNFQGMTTGKELEILAFGPSGISQLETAFAQNHKTTLQWQEALSVGLSIEKGRRLSEDDRLRRELMQQLYGYGVIDKRRLEADHKIDFDDYFSDERDRLSDLVQEGFVAESETEIRLRTPLGRFLVRVIAAIFDRYLEPNAYRRGVTQIKASKVG